MINKINEKIYNYIFSVNESTKKGTIENDVDKTKDLDKIISEYYEVTSDFWEENMNDFNNRCIATLDGIDAPYVYINFPRMTSSTREDFLNYKLKQIRNSIEKNGDFIEVDIKKNFKNIDNIAIKTILDYCEEEGIIKYFGNVYVSYDNNPAAIISYKNIKTGLKNSKIKQIDEKIFKTGFLIEYKEICKIKESANADIYEVKDEEGKEYIIKMLTKEISTVKLKRFRNEINFGKIYKSKYVVEVIDNGIKKNDGKDCMFYVMPKYKCNFREVLNKGIEKSKILKYFNNILEGIKFIHSKNAYHRDLKPENILFDEENDIMIISDLGIAHFNEDVLIDNPQTKLTDRMANFQYAAPEQRKRKSKVDYRCDIYSLGLILNEMFTNEIIQGSNYKKIVEVCEEYSFLDDIVEKMTEQNPDNRYNSIEEIQYEINARMESYIKKKEIEGLKRIEIEKSEEDDGLIIEPIKIIDVKLEESGMLKIVLNKEPNGVWKELIIKVDKTQIVGCEPEKFKFYGNTAILFLSYSKIDSVPKIIDLFKDWIASVNKIYPKEIAKIRKKENEEREREVKARIEFEEKLEEIRRKIKI